ncbi:MAG: tetratricopeptide repeat protein [Candidatus Obscuribacterales bacterium]|nr:tetratricopeptide repeat protein [Candidatus Obscuribacterales bacterium]
MRRRSFSACWSLFIACAGLTLFVPGLVTAQNAAPLPVKKISADMAQQIIVEFAGEAFPSTPQVLDLPGPNHRVVIDFVDASIDRSSLLSQDDLSKNINQTLPFVKSVRYCDIENAPQPTARLVVDLPEEIAVKPRVVRLEKGVAVIGFSDQPIVLPHAAKPESSVVMAVAPVAEQKQGDTRAVPLDPPPPAATPAKNLKTAAADAPTAVESSPLRAEIPVENKEPEQAAETPAPKKEEAAELAEKNEAAKKAEAEAAAKATAKAAADQIKLDSVKAYNKAVQLHLSGKLNEAVEAYKEALKSNGELAEAHSNLGLIFNQQHNYAEALVEFRKALAINPKDAITYNGVGAALRAQRDLLGAIKNWQTAVSLDPKLATAQYNLGTAYEIQKEYDQAIVSYRAAVKNDYRLGEAYYRMGLIMERKHRSEEAAEHFKEALKVSATSEYSEDARQRLAYLEGKKGK